jgi:hypothetical protein
MFNAKATVNFYHLVKSRLRLASFLSRTALETLLECLTFCLISQHPVEPPCDRSPRKEAKPDPDAKPQADP